MSESPKLSESPKQLSKKPTVVSDSRRCFMWEMQGWGANRSVMFHFLKLIPSHCSIEDTDLYLRLRCSLIPVLSQPIWKEALNKILKIHFLYFLGFFLFLFLSERTKMSVLITPVNPWDLLGLPQEKPSHWECCWKRLRNSSWSERQEWQKVCSISSHYLYRVGCNQLSSGPKTVIQSACFPRLLICWHFLSWRCFFLWSESSWGLYASMCRVVSEGQCEADTDTCVPPSPPEKHKS